jgi:hypothetical protein
MTLIFIYMGTNITVRKKLGDRFVKVLLFFVLKYFWPSLTSIQ